MIHLHIRSFVLGGLSLAFLFTLAASAHAATYYAAPGGSTTSGCTQGQPCDLARALQLLAGSDTLIMAGGDYSSGFGHPYNVNVPSGSSGAPTIIQAASGQTPIIRSITMPGGTSAGLHDIVFDGITVDGAGMGFGNGDHISFLNGVSRNARDATAAGQGINVSGGKHDIRIANTKIYGADLYGLYISWHDSILENNDIYDNNSYGLHFFCGQYPDGTRPCAKPGGDPYVAYVANNIIRNNRVWGNGFCNIPGTTCLIGSGNGIVIGAGPNNQFYSNLIFDNNNGGLQVYPGCIDCKFYNNTIWRNQGPGITLDTGGGSSGPPRPVIKNNIIYQHTQVIADQGAISPDISHNFTSDPQFINPPSEFHLQSGSPAKTASDTGGEVGAYGNGGGGNPTPTPTATPNPTPAGSLCSTLTPGTTIGQGFGTPWNVFNVGEMLLKAYCSGQTITAQVGPSTYVYHEGYGWSNNQWLKTSFNCSGGAKVNNAWCPTSAQGTLPNNSTYYVGYTCSWTGTVWRCGCADTACTSNYWQLQKIN